MNTDSAMSSKRDRPFFLECLKNTTSHFLDFLSFNQLEFLPKEIRSECHIPHNFVISVEAEWFDLKEMFTNQNSLPSLKSIKIEYDDDYVDDDVDTEVGLTNITLKYINASSNMESLYITLSPAVRLNNSIFLAAESLKSLTLDHINVEQLNKCTEILGEMKFLKKLVIIMTDFFWDGELNDIMTFTETTFKNLTELEFRLETPDEINYKINPFKTISESSFGKNLERLSLDVCTDGDFEELNFPNLKYLRIADGIPEDEDDFIDFLTDYCTKLEEIDIVCENLTDEGLTFLAERCPSISKITIRNMDRLPSSIEDDVTAFRIQYPQISVLNIKYGGFW
jgi:6-pyruvoyl-tetrahydropterin synthase